MSSFSVSLFSGVLKLREQEGGCEEPYPSSDFAAMAESFPGVVKKITGQQLVSALLAASDEWKHMP